MKEIKELTIQQQIEAEALYLHLLNHKEVQEAPVNKGMPVCKICNKTAHEILMSEPFMKQMSDLMDKTEESPYNAVQRMTLLVQNSNEQIREKNQSLALVENDLDIALRQLKIAKGRL